MENPVHYLHIYFYFSYYLGATPFRIKRDKKTGLMEFHENIVQKVICGIIHGFGLYQFIPSLLVLDLFDSEKTSIAVFDLAALLGGMGYQISLIVALWFHKEIFLNICDQIHGNELLIARISGKRKVQIVMIALGIIFTITAIFYVFMASGLQKSIDWTPKSAFQAYIKRARLMTIFDVSSSASAATDIKPDNPITPLNYTLTSIYLVLKLLSRIQYHLSDFSVLMFAMMLHHLARDFLIAMKTGGVESGLSFEKIKAHFYAVKDVVGSINKVYGNVFLWWVFESMPYYAGHFDEIFRNQDPLQQTRHGLYFLNYMCILVIAADGHAKIGRFKDWLSEEENFPMIDVNHLTVLLNELSSHTVGLNGKDFLTIHYDFFAAMVSLILTYAIIVVEFKPAASTSLSFAAYNNVL